MELSDKLHKDASGDLEPRMDVLHMEHMDYIQHMEGKAIEQI
jgi:hypothetical protein